MRAVALALVAAAGLALAGTSAAKIDRSAKASLRLASLSPLAVRGAGFAPRERVRVDLSGAVTARRRIVAGPTGAFAVRFDGVVLTRCDLVRVVATGSRGSRATLKLLPSPACLPA
jgi:hypothetical protein